MGSLGGRELENTAPTYPVRQKTKDGTTLFEWADIDDAPRKHVEKNVQQERRQVASDCYALAMKVEHYNEAHPAEEPLQLILEFTDDVEEMKISRGLDDGEGEVGEAAD